MKEPYRTRRGSPRAPARWLTLTLAAAVCGFGAGGPAVAAVTPIEPYLIASARQEIALARSAAPPAVAGHASVLVLEEHGYVTAVKGTNGFVCLVTRSWDNQLDAKRGDFFNPKFRAPFCYNAVAARSVLPLYLMRTRWVIAGASERQIAAREKAGWAAGRLEEPKVGGLCYMMSRRGALNDGTPWRPHVMLYFPHGKASSWGANLQGAPIMAGAGDHTTILYILVPYWSDGTPAPRH